MFLETPTIGRMHFTLAKLDPTNGKVLETQTVPMHCRTAAIILNKQLMQNIVPLTDVTGGKHSKVAENIAKSQNLSLNGASISDKEKTTLAENAAEIQGELDEIPSIAIDALPKTSSGSLTSISQDPISFLNQVWEVAERHNGNGDLEFTDLSREVPGFSPIGVTGTLTAAMQVNQAEIQANMIYGNLILNCLTNEKNCIQYNTLMLDARSKAAIDSAGEASMFQHYMHYGMNILLFIYVVMSPIMVIVIIAMGIQGWRLVKSYLLFSVWINSWLPLSIAIAYYQLHTYTTAIEKLASSLTSPEMILSPVVLNSILNGAQDTIATASTFMSSVPLIMLSLLGGSIYGLTQLAQKAGMTGKDYINEGFATQSSLDASTYAGGYAQALLASTNFRATSANALNAFQGPNQQDTVGITLKMSTSALKNVMDSKSAEVAMMESLSNTESFSDLMSYAEGQGKTVVIGLNEQGQFAVAMGDSADSSLTRNWQYAAQMKYGPGGLLTDVHNNIGVSDAVSIKRANGETVSLGSGYQFQKGDQLVINGTTETSEMFQTAIAQSTSDARKEAYALQNTYARSEGMESSIPLNSDLIKQAFFSSNGSTAFAYAVQEAKKYDGDFAQRLANAETPFDQYKVLVDGIHSKDENTFEAATRAASEYIGKANNVTNGLFISDQLLAYNLVQKNGAEAEEHVMAAYNSDISYSNANSVGTFENQKLNMSREEVIQKARSLPLGKEKMEQLYALQHDGRTVEQAHKLGEANMKYIQDTMSKLTQETIELGNKIQKNHGAEIAEEYWKNANYLLDKENGTTWDKVMGAVGVVTGMATYSLSKVPVLGTYFNQLLDIYSNELNTSQEGLTDQLRKLADTVKDPEKLQTVPLTKEIETMVSAPKYAPARSVDAAQHTENQERLNRQPEKPVITNPRMMHAVGNSSNADKALNTAKEFMGDLAQGAVQTFLGITPAHADTMDLLHKPTVGQDKKIKINDSNKTSYDKENHTLNLSEKDVERIIRVTATEAAHNIKDDEQYNKQVDAIVDTVLNRAALANGNVVGVINKRAAFSDINSSRKSAYGNVDNVPESRVSPRLKAEVIAHLQRRAAGEDSIIDGNTHYANPNVVFGKKSEASEPTKKWVREAMEQADKTGHKFGKGAFVHIHGTPKGEKKAPKFDISIPQKYVNEEKK